MNKSELIQAVAESADIPKATAAKAVDAFVENVKDSLAKGDQVTLIGFGTFSTLKQRMCLFSNQVKL